MPLRNELSACSRRKMVAGVLLGLALPHLALAQVEYDAAAAQGHPRTPQTPALPLAQSLSAEAQAAQAQAEPLVVMVNLAGCPWCLQVRRNYLAPMHVREGLPAVQVDMNSAQPVRDFDGTLTTHAELLRRWRVDMAPTVLFFDVNGAELAPRLVGMSPDFYSAQLDSRLRAARLALGVDPS